MRCVMRFAVRSLVVLVAAAGFHAVVSVSTPMTSPYVSALSPLAVQPAYAAKGCNNKGCVGGGHRHLNCGNLDGYTCTNLPGSCFANPC